MKKSLIYLSLILALAFCLWLALRRTAPILKQEAPPQQVQPSTPPKIEPPPITNAPQVTAQEADFPRPRGIDDDGWKWFLAIRKVALEANQPVEFYARILDQKEHPVEGATLKLMLTYLNEDMFRTTNVFHMKMGDEVVNKPLEFVSDADGWIRLDGVKGYIVDIRGLSKEGYLMRDYYGSVRYEPHGVRNTSGGDILLTNALNPNVGYTFHLEKQ